MDSSRWLSRFMIAVVAFVLCGGPELLQAQQPTQPPATQQDQDDTPVTSPATDQSSQPPVQQDQNVGTTQQNATPDPSKGPLQPAETNTLPNAPSSSQPAQQSPQQPAQAPAGGAAAQGVKTAGGAASRPAGTAIAPAKQHQARSLLIKISAIAAGAAALGTIYALSRGSSSVPPGVH
ncbi:MAG TPA: hypothetical protein VG897_14005 [Terriglobales bacterium]|nr:hypothetical protein [Terriglobales bacterium]